LGYIYFEDDKRKVFASSSSSQNADLAQSAVVSGGMDTGGILVIHLDKNVNLEKIIEVASNLPEIAKQVADGQTIYTSVCFGTQFWEKLSLLNKSIKKPNDFEHYVTRNGKYGSIPATGGDILLHIKSKTRSEAFEIFQIFLQSLPKGSVISFFDEYGWQYKDGRDLSGFLDGTENVSDQLARKEATLLPNGGSFLLHQRWHHNLKFFNSLSVEEQEKIVGRTKVDSARLDQLPKSSHVARSRDDQDKQIPIVRQSMPFGSLKGPLGLLFIAYSNSPSKFDLILDRMVGASGGKENDAIMSFSICMTSQYFYVPSVEELVSLRSQFRN